MNARPNLLFVFPDEWRRQALGFMNQDPVLTPHLDRFAEESRVLTHAVSNFPVCSPYRAMLLTGKYPHKSGVLFNCKSGEPTCYLRPGERCVSDVLHDAGYNCGWIGKWHLEHPREPYVEPARPDGHVWDEWTPPDRRHGFDFWYSYGVFDNHFRPHYWDNHAPRESPLQIQEWSPRHEADVAIGYLRNDAGQRERLRLVALFVSMNPPHMPFELVPPPYIARYKDKTSEELLNRPNVRFDGEGEKTRRHAKNYFAACTGVDEQFGRLLDALRETGMEENTIVVFTSDHGEMMGSQGRMFKTTFYEESLGVPFVIRWPKRILPGRDDLLLSAPDLMPSLLGLMGLSDQIPEAVEGSDLSNALRGEAGPRPDSALYLRASTHNPSGGARGVRTHRHTFVIEKAAGGEIRLLFDMETDPYQLKNIADDEPQIVAQLTRTLNDWLRKTGDPWLGKGERLWYLFSA